VEGTEKFCEDLQVDPSDIVMLVIAFHLECHRMCEFTREEWISGWSKLNCDTLEAMRNKIPKLRDQLYDETLFKQVYEYAYVFSREEGQKSLRTLSIFCAIDDTFPFFPLDLLKIPVL
jgi:DCN1-like protein 1/2